MISSADAVVVPVVRDDEEKGAKADDDDDDDDNTPTESIISKKKVGTTSTSSRTGGGGGGGGTKYTDLRVKPEYVVKERPACLGPLPDHSFASSANDDREGGGHHADGDDGDGDDDNHNGHNDDRHNHNGHNNNNSNNKKNKKRPRGQNKKRPRDALPSRSERLCHMILRGEACPRGDSCVFSHDMKLALSSRLPDIDEIDTGCPHYNLRGYCEFGILCRLGSSHVNLATGENLRRPSSSPSTASSSSSGRDDPTTTSSSSVSSSVMNVIPKEVLTKLRKRQYQFRCKRYNERSSDKPRPRKHNDDKEHGHEEKDKNNDDVRKSDQTTKQEKEKEENDNKDEGANNNKSNDDNNNDDDNDNNNNNNNRVHEKTKTDDEKDNHDEAEKREVEKQKENEKLDEVMEDVKAEEKKKTEKNDDGDKMAENAQGCAAADADADAVGDVKTTSSKIGIHSQQQQQNPTQPRPQSQPRPQRPSEREGVSVDFAPLPSRERKLVDFRNKVYVAPLTTVGNLPFRRIMKRFGADITCGEMALVPNLLMGQPSEWALLKRHPSEDVFGVQIAAGHADQFTRLCEVLESHLTVDFVDLNLGCPLDLVCKKGAGAALMLKENPLRSSLVGIVNTLSCPVTIKMRTGWNEHKPIAHKLVSKIRGWNIGGINAIFVHGRSRLQRYSKLADWDYISHVATSQSVGDNGNGGNNNNDDDDDDPARLPVIGNGDIFSFTDYEEKMQRTEGIEYTAMLSRGALIKPWLPTEIKERKHWDISSAERLDILRQFVRYGLEHWGSDTEGVNKTRRFLLEWLSFLYRYVPVGLLEVLPQQMNQRPPNHMIGRDDLETLMMSKHCSDWIRLTEMLLGKVPDGFRFEPKHKANSYAT